MRPFYLDTENFTLSILLKTSLDSEAIVYRGYCQTVDHRKYCWHCTSKYQDFRIARVYDINSKEKLYLRSK